MHMHTHMPIPFQHERTYNFSKEPTRLALHAPWGVTVPLLDSALLSTPYPQYTQRPNAIVVGRSEAGYC